MTRAPEAQNGTATSPLLNEEVLRSVAGQAAAGPAYFVYMAVAGVLAAVALLSNSIPILVGSMVVAPALAPLMLVPMALVVGRWRLAGRGLGTAMAGLTLAFLLALLTTWVMNATSVIDPATNLLDKPLLEERVRPGWWTMVAAIGAGVAGTIAQASSKTDALVGVVAALALVPAAAAAAIALTSHDPARALGALVLMAVNVALIIAVGMLTMLATTGRAAWRPVLVLPVVVIGLVLLLLAWATSANQVPTQPTSTVTSSTG